MKANPWKRILPVVLVVAGGLVAWALVASRPDVPEQVETTPAPRVDVTVATLTDLRLDVVSQGSVVPATESLLAAQVPGRVEWVSPDLRAGGFFEAG